MVFFDLPFGLFFLDKAIILSLESDNDPLLFVSCFYLKGSREVN